MAIRSQFGESRPLCFYAVSQHLAPYRRTKITRQDFLIRPGYPTSCVVLNFNITPVLKSGIGGSC